MMIGTVLTGRLMVAQVLRPGFVRVSFPYHLPRTAFEYLVNSVLWLADNGHRFLPQYSVCPSSGEWKHISIG